MQDLDSFYLLDSTLDCAQAAKCFLLEDNAVLMQRADVRPCSGPHQGRESVGVIIDVVGVLGADLAATWVLHLA